MTQEAKAKSHFRPVGPRFNVRAAALGVILLLVSFALPLVFPSQSTIALSIVGLTFIFGAAFVGLAILQSVAGGRASEKVAQLEQALQEERAARRKAEWSDAAKSRLLGTVSHDIRTPLSGITGMCHLLAQSNMTAEQRNYLTGIRQSSNTLAQLVDDLLDFVSMEAGRFQLRPQEESVRTLLESVVEMLAHRAHEKGIEISSWVSSDVPEVISFDPARMRQVLFNIIGNAVKFTQEGGVYVEAALERSALVIRVTDTGPGMTLEEQDRIFGEFEQVGSLREKSGGTGLGLSISARIVAEAGGDITVTSEKGRGSTFTVRLPVELSGDFGARDNRGSVLRKSVVLIVSPEGPTSHALQKTVETLGGKSVHAARVADAGELLGNSEFHFTDIIVDHRDADDFTALLARNPDLAPKNVRKVFLVNPENRTSRITGIGFDAWLVRPLRERSLVDVLSGRMRGIELRDPLNDNRSGPTASRFTAPESTSLKVLLAEDDPVNALLVRATLSKAGHKVHTVEDYDSLIDAATAFDSRPDILITDLSMPGGNGLDAVVEIRSYESDLGLEKLPVIVVSGRNDDDVKRLAEASGVAAVLLKPADPANLVELVSKFGFAEQRQA